VGTAGVSEDEAQGCESGRTGLPSGTGREDGQARGAERAGGRRSRRLGAGGARASPRLELARRRLRSPLALRLVRSPRIRPLDFKHGYLQVVQGQAPLHRASPLAVCPPSPSPSPAKLASTTASPRQRPAWVLRPVRPSSGASRALSDRPGPPDPAAGSEKRSRPRPDPLFLHRVPRRRLTVRSGSTRLVVNPRLPSSALSASTPSARVVATSSTAPSASSRARARASPQRAGVACERRAQF